MKRFIQILIMTGLLFGLTGCMTSCDQKVAKWDECTKASCWNGNNAQQRMMNMLSPGMPDSKFDSYMNWMKDRGCNTAHLIIANRADGEHGMYCIYGNYWTWQVNQGFVDVMKNRIEKLHDNGFAIVIWLFTDDSKPYTDIAKQNFPQYLNDVKSAGLLELASTVVVGLELEDYYNHTPTVAALINATRAVYDGKIGTHETPGNIKFAGLSDITFYQVSPGKSDAYIQNKAAQIRAATGKPLNFHEIERQPARGKCEAAMRGGAFGVGNW